jgi:hypothetical protein
MLLFGLSLAAGTQASAASNDLSLCLDASTRLEAGGDVGDKELQAAQAACARLAATQPDHAESIKINAAVATLNDERQRRASQHH